MKQPYLSAEMNIHSFAACDVICCSDTAVDPDIRDEVVTTADPDEWVPSCNQGKPDYNAWD